MIKLNEKLHPWKLVQPDSDVASDIINVAGNSTRPHVIEKALMAPFPIAISIILEVVMFLA